MASNSTDGDRVIHRVRPDTQPRTISELTDDLDLTAGDAAAKRSAFWTMLTLSAVLASAGVLTDFHRHSDRRDDHRPAVGITVIVTGSRGSRITAGQTQ